MSKEFGIGSRKSDSCLVFLLIMLLVLVKLIEFSDIIIDKFSVKFNELEVLEIEKTMRCFQQTQNNNLICLKSR